MQNDLTDSSLSFSPSFPQDFSRKASNQLAVIVYIHGESFKWGSGNLWDATILAAFGNVVVVTFNFRLGLFGTLSRPGKKTKLSGSLVFELRDFKSVTF